MQAEYHFRAYHVNHQSGVFLHHNCDMDTLAERLKTTRIERGLTQGALAKLSGLKNQSIIGSLESGYRKNSSYIPQIAAALEVNSLWLSAGIGSKEIIPFNTPTDFQVNVTAQHHAPRNRVPVISAVQAGEFSFTGDQLPPGYAEEYIETSVPVKSRTFALKVKGDSMEPEFTEGMILIVEPEMDFSPNDFVIVKNGDEATFKQLIKDGLDWYLKPLNPRYPIKPLGGAKIIGVVREVTRRLK